jgi:hypothetical protein
MLRVSSNNLCRTIYTTLAVDKTTSSSRIYHHFDTSHRPKTTMTTTRVWTMTVNEWGLSPSMFFFVLLVYY